MAQSSADALTAAQSYQSSMQTPQQELDAANQQYGTNAAQQQVAGLRSAIASTTNLLNNVAPGVMGRTGQSLETTAQANREIQNEQAPISQTLDKQNTDYQTANADYTDAEQKAEALANANESSQQNQLGYLFNVYNALYGQEQAAAQAKAQQDQFEQSLAEQAREANLSASASSGALSPTLNSGGGGASSGGGSLTGGKTSDDAYGAVKSLIGTKSASTIINTYNAIKASAGYGNTYDQAKLQLLQSLEPGWFKGGQLNTSYLNTLASKGMLI